MKRNYPSIFAPLFIITILVAIYLTMMPHWAGDKDIPLTKFSTKRALEKVAEISQQPHYVGSENHKTVAAYLQNELQQLGLETQIQEGTTLSDWGNLVKSKNIMARIKGTSNSKALVLLSHYDSAPHSYSPGAADDASGVAVILESVRTFLQTRTPHKNDIIILFTDAEELGLNGAALFVTQSEWAKEVGLVLNFEARGTAGPGYMLMEVNAGNSALVDGFADASPAYPVSNSLMYSIYKMLPNDTDLTVFREHGKIPGFNFAFIDDHFNYHTAQDDIAHLSPRSVAHQGSYLMPLLKHFSNSDLSTLKSDDDQVYFNAPYSFFHYSFGLNFPLLAIAIVLFLFLVFVGLGKRILVASEIGTGFLLFFAALLISGGLSFFGWTLLKTIYPRYTDILHGFTYNGHAYMAAFAALTLAVLFFVYRNSRLATATVNYMVAPLLFWLLINLGLAVFLPGGAYFIIPVLFALLMFAFSIITQKNSNGFNLLMGIPALVIFVPFIWMFPIGLGLKMLFGSSLLIVLVFTLVLPVFSTFSRKIVWGIFFLITSIGFFVYAHLNSDYEPGKAKPNSLLYVYDADSDKAFWTTYDTNLDEWTKLYLTDAPKPAKALADIPLFSKYKSGFIYEATALVRDLAEPVIQFERDSIIGTQRYLRIRITPQRPVNRYDIFASPKMDFHNLKANGANALGQKGSLYPRNGSKILSYYVVDNEPLVLEFSIPITTKFDMQLLESSFDLLRNPIFEMKKRSADMMPLPFVLNDAIAIRKKINPSASNLPMPVRKDFRLSAGMINDTIEDFDRPADTTAINED